MEFSGEQAIGDGRRCTVAAVDTAASGRRRNIANKSTAGNVRSRRSGISYSAALLASGVIDKNTVTDGGG